MANNGTTGHETEAVNVQDLKATLQKLKTDYVDPKADKATTYTKTEVNGLVDTPHQNYMTVAATSQTTAATDVLPASGQAADTIYRVSNWDGSANSGAGAFDVSCYSEYAWDDASNPNKYVFLCVKSQIGEVFDISVYNNNAKYADLTAALGTNGANIPDTLRKGGMSVKFVQSSDNKYVQFRYMSSSTAAADFTNVANWQGVDDVPTDESENLVKSGGVNKRISHINISNINNSTYDSLASALLSTPQVYQKDYIEVVSFNTGTTLVSCKRKIKEWSNNINDWATVVATNNISEQDEREEGEDVVLFLDDEDNTAVSVDKRGIHAVNLPTEVETSEEEDCVQFIGDDNNEAARIDKKGVHAVNLPTEEETNKQEDTLEFLDENDILSAKVDKDGVHSKHLKFLDGFDVRSHLSIFPSKREIASSNLLNKRRLWSIDDSLDINEYGKSVIFSTDEQGVITDRIGILGKVEKNFEMSFNFDFDKYENNSALFKVCFVHSDGSVTSVGCENSGNISNILKITRNSSTATFGSQGVSIFSKIEIRGDYGNNKVTVYAGSEHEEISDVSFIYFDISVTSSNKVFLRNYHSKDYTFERDCYYGDFLWVYPCCTFGSYLAFAYYDKEYLSNSEFHIERYNILEPDYAHVDTFYTRYNNNPTSSVYPGASDLHNYLEMDVDNSGYIHLIGNAHDHIPLYYYGKIDNSVSIQDIWNTKIAERITYPQLFHYKGEFYLTYRTGTSGDGQWKVYKYTSGDWIATTNTYIANGKANANKSCPYLQRWVIDEKNGKCYNSWCWRKNANNNSNYDIMFIETEDFVTFQNYKHEDIEIPITTANYEENCLVYKYPQGSGLLNQNWILTAVVDNKPNIVFAVNDENGINQVYVSDFINLTQITDNKFQKDASDGRQLRFWIYNNDDGNAFVFVLNKNEESFVAMINKGGIYSGKIYDWLINEKPNIGLSPNYKMLIHSQDMKTNIGFSKIIIGY